MSFARASIQAGVVTAVQPFKLTDNGDIVSTLQKRKQDTAATLIDLPPIRKRAKTLSVKVLHVFVEHN